MIPTADQFIGWARVMLHPPEYLSRRFSAAGDGERRVTTRVMSRYRDRMVKQTTVRLPEDLADDAEAVARVKGTSVNQLIVDSLSAEINRVRTDKDFTQRAKRLLERDKELLERLAK